MPVALKQGWGTSSRVLASMTRIERAEFWDVFVAEPGPVLALRSQTALNWRGQLSDVNQTIVGAP